ncbi:hypothetical protein PM082_024689 [Marasmius tenuissimus]|nr:hypothetical protein PM082_024689 [Marasmius tenuissimus]
MMYLIARFHIHQPITTPEAVGLFHDLTGEVSRYTTLGDSCTLNQGKEYFAIEEPCFSVGHTGVLRWPAATTHLLWFVIVIASTLPLNKAREPPTTAPRPPISLNLSCLPRHHVSTYPPLTL